MPQAVSRFQKGATNVGPNHPLFQTPIQDLTKWHYYQNDWEQYVAADWTVTNVGTTPTQALGNTDGGVLLLTTTAGATDSTYLVKVGAGFLLATGKQFGIRARFSLSDSTNSRFDFGLVNIGATFASAVTDGIQFSKPTGAQTVNLITTSGSTATTTSAIATMADATFIELAAYGDGAGNISYYVNNQRSGTVALTLPTVVLSPAFGVQNGAAAIKTATIDLLQAYNERLLLNRD